MSFTKELLLSCIVIMHIAIMPSQQLDLEKLGKNLKTKLSFCNLVNTEQLYVNNIFHKKRPITNKVKSPEGIAIPVGNSTKEIQASLCAIDDYLDNHLPPIIRNLTTQSNQDDLISNITAFHYQFKAAVQLSSSKDAAVLQSCHRNIPTLDKYKMKEIGFQIIHYTKLWVEGFTNTTIC